MGCRRKPNDSYLGLGRLHDHSAHRIHGPLEAMPPTYEKGEQMISHQKEHHHGCC